MFRVIRMSAIVLTGLVTLAQPLSAAHRFVIRRASAVVVRPYYGFRPYSGFGYGWVGPRWSYPSWGPTYVVPRAKTGEVKIKTHFKDAVVYVDGGYAGVASKLKEFELSPGSHDLELRDSSGRSIYRERIEVIRDKTTEIKVD
jgi:hypothetical protein